MHNLLTAARINAARAKAKSKGDEVWISDDPGSRGSGRLNARVRPTGVVRFYYRFPRTRGKSEKTQPLGLYSRISRTGHLTLTQARKMADKLSVGLAANGLEYIPVLTSPPEATGSAVSSKQEAVASSPATLLEICRDYAQSLADTGKASARAVLGSWERYIAPSSLADRSANSIKADEITVLIRQIKNEVSGPTARKIRSYLHTVYEYAQSDCSCRSSC